MLVSIWLARLGNICGHKRSICRGKFVEYKKKRCLIAAALFMASCSGSGSDESTGEPGDAEATTTAVVATEDTEATPADEDPGDDGGDGGDGGDGSDTEAALVGRTGPIRELPGLSEWADLDLHEFVVEVMMFPEEIPVPDNLVATWLTTSQTFTAEGDESRVVVSATFQPMLSVEEFGTDVSESAAENGFTLLEKEDDLENNRVRWDFLHEDPDAAVNSFFYMYTAADSSNQAEVYMQSVGNYVGGTGELMVNEALFPWVSEVAMEATMSNDSVAYSLGRLEGIAEVDRRWKAPSTEFDSLSSFVSAPASAGLSAASEQEYSETVWPSNRIDIAREDGFDGEFVVNLTDPEADVTVLLVGSYLLD